MSLDKKIQDTFNPPPSLDGEDWLMPSDDVFDAIEGAVYADDSSRKRRFPFWLWLFPVLSISVLTFIFFNNDVEEKLHTNNSEMHLPEASESMQLTGKESSDNDIFISSENTKTKSSLLISEYSSETIVTSNESKVNNSISNELVNSQGSVSITDQFVNEINLELLKEKFEIAETQSSSDGKLIDRVSIETYPQIRYLEHMVLLSSSDKHFTGTPKSIDPITINHPHAQNWFVKFSTGMSQWNFNLSNNYLVALQPADFSYSNGSGYFLELGIEKNISSRINLGILASYDRNQFDSGHNSIVNYDLSTENGDRTKGFDLTMASPLGFLESNIIVARSIDAPNNTNLTIDLDNRHIVSNLDLGLFADVNLIEYDRLGLSTQLGGGMSYLSHVSNSLNKFSTSESGFDSHSSNITSNQTDLKRLRSYFNVGFNLGYAWSSTTIFGLSYQYRRDINSIYQSGDFSTLVQRQLSGIYLKKRI